ncbi:MAG: diaminopimelate decarboxylase [Dehalococcoidia bacterium]|nr:diaminopimelate decarboxylase [Dehalococcoidia bacterium]
MDAFPAKHVFPQTAAITASGHLVLGGCDVADLAAEYGTPLYIFDEQTLRERCQAYLREFQGRYPNTRVIYASKAFTNLALTRLLVEEGLGMDVASGGEMAAARVGGMPPSRVYFHGNNKSRQELEEGLAWGVGRFVVDNFHELGLLNDVARKAGRTQDILLRVSPNVDPHTHAYISTGTLDSKFGFPIGTGQAQEAIRQALSCSHLRLVGLHCHIGSQVFETQPYQAAIRATLEFAAKMREDGLELREFSPGGGFGIPYTRNEQPPSTAQYADAITSSFSRGCQELGLSEPLLVIEPGRSIVGPAGVAIYTVGARKAIPGIRTYVSVDGGMGDNIRPALYQASYEAVVANRMGQPATERVTIAGKFCESGDILVRDVDIPATEPGDLVALPAAGAYCVPMSSNYNMAPRPAIIMVRDGVARLIRRRETYQDLMASDVA